MSLPPAGHRPTPRGAVPAGRSGEDPGDAHPRREGEISFRTRKRMVLGAGLALAVLLAWGLAGLPDAADFTPLYGQAINAVAPEERGTTAVVTAVIFDYRAWDTLGEELLFFAAVLGGSVLLRRQEDEHRIDVQDALPERDAPPTSAAVRLVTTLLVGPTVLVAIYLVAHGHLTPGGGFSGGVVAATGLLLVYLGGDYRALQRVQPLQVSQVLKAAGQASFILLGLGGLLVVGSFLENALATGTAGELVAGGLIPPLNVAVGIEVTGGFVLLLTGFLQQLLVIRAGREPSA